MEDLSLGEERGKDCGRLAKLSETGTLSHSFLLRAAAWEPAQETHWAPSSGENTVNQPRRKMAGGEVQERKWQHFINIWSTNKFVTKVNYAAIFWIHNCITRIDHEPSHYWIALFWAIILEVTVLLPLLNLISCTHVLTSLNHANETERLAMSPLLERPLCSGSPRWV